MSKRERRNRRDAGTVTAEFAAGLPILVVLLAIALGAVSAVTTQLRCEHAAYQAVRAATRGADTSEVTATMPDGARLRIGETDSGYGGDGMVTATVTARVRILGAKLPVITVVATRVAASERPTGSP
ncbi:MAG: TadE family type IV pilus minor pilin [Mycobacteriales bacterium]